MKETSRRWWVRAVGVLSVQSHRRGQRQVRVIKEGMIVRVASLVAALLTLGGILAGAAAPAAADDGRSTPAREGSHPAADDLAKKPIRSKAPRSTSRSCAPTSTAVYKCVKVTVGASQTASSQGDALAAADVPFPTWCTSSTTLGFRTEACRATQVTLTTSQTVNGATRVTGVLNMHMFNYTYSATDLPNFAHQVGISSYNGWGDALRAQVSGSASASGSCTTTSSSFPSQQVTPHNNIREGEAFFATTATAIDAVGFCTTIWNLLFTVTGYPPATLSTSMDDIRCDNATGANGFRPRRVGCVVYWYASAVTYSETRHPTLALHVSRAQQSGLPGKSFAAPLTRTTDQATINLNRSLACGDAPSVPELQCDEYPLASSRQGLAAGGTRRSFPGCLINAPQDTGPTGASACMINASDNRAQGALMAAFYYDWRVLDGDPYRVLVGT